MPRPREIRKNVCSQNGIEYGRITDGRYISNR